MELLPVGRVSVTDLSSEGYTIIDMRSRGGYGHGLTGKKRERIVGSTAVCCTATAHILWTTISGWG